MAGGGVSRLDFTDADKAQFLTTTPDSSSSGLVTRPVLPHSQFGELITAERTPIIELNSSYGTSLLRDVIETTNSGSVTLCVRTLSGTGTVTANFRVQEEW